MNRWVAISSFVLLAVGATGVVAQPAASPPQLAAGASMNQSAFYLRRFEKRLRSHLDEQPKDVYALDQLGSLLYRQGQAAAATRIWERASKLDKQAPPAPIKVAIELANQRQFSAAIAAIEAAKRTGVGNTHIQMARAQIAMMQGVVSVASQALNAVSESAGETVDFAVFSAVLSELNGDRKKADALYAQAAERDPKRPDVWILRASSAFRAGDLKATKQHLQQAESRDPLQVLAETRLAQFHFRKNDLLGARKWFAAALKRTPKDPLALMSIALVEARLGLYDRARDHLMATLQLEENAEAFVHLGNIAETTRQDEAAAKHYRRALQLDPGNPVANNNLAMMLLRLNRKPQEAVRLCAAAVRAHPTNLGLLSTYACALVEVGEYRRAEPLLRRALRSFPNDPWTRFSLGKLLLKSNADEDGKELLEECLILDKDFPRKDEIQRLLRDD